MALADRVYEWLASGPTPGSERALGDALRYAEPAYFDRLADCLIQRRTPAAWSALISRYADLSANIRTAIKAEPDLVMAGISTAMKSGDADVRMNALEAYGDTPSERLSHLLPQALRDSSLPVRSRAAEVLRVVSAAVYSKWERRLESSADDEKGELEQSVRKMVDTLRDILRTIDIHRRVETVEPCIWFCEQIGSALWQAINKPRSRVAHVLSERLSEWNETRIAPFLLRASATPEWRREAHKLLAAWQTPDQLTALLRNTSMLGDPAIRRGVLGIKNPKWFAKLAWELSDVPEELRRFAPNWVVAGGFTDRERVAYLTRWAAAAHLRLSEAAAHALAKLGHADTLPIRAAAATPRSRAAAPVHGGPAASQRDHHAPFERAAVAHADPPAVVDDSHSPEFAMLWKLCRRTPPGENGELLTLLLEHIGVWGHRLADCARSPDPRDRILSLQIIRAGGLVERFREQLEALQRDKIEGIRKLAAVILESPGAGVTLPCVDSPAQQITPSQEARDTLKTIITKLIKRDDIRAEESVLLLEELKTRLRQLYGETASASPPEKSGQEVSR